MFTSPNIIVYQVPDINSVKRVPQINFMSIFTTLRGFISDLFINSYNEDFSARTLGNTHKEEAKSSSIKPF